jgi:Crp-like helix-turn-helix domain
MISVACNGAHNVKERLARWLLMMRDRSDDDALSLTQGLLAEMLGVRRPTITNVLREFQRAGLVEPSRRRVTIRNRRGLMGESCECYELVRPALLDTYPKPSRKTRADRQCRVPTRRNCFSRNASAISVQPCSIANEPMTHTRARAPEPGRAISKTPKAIESRPRRINHHSASISFRSWMAPQISSVTIAQPAINISKTSAVSPGDANATNPARRPTMVTTAST